jgi:hypothetical protein
MFEVAMRSVKAVLTGIGYCLGAIYFGVLFLIMAGGIAFVFVGLPYVAVMTPIQWYYGECSPEYVAEWKAWRYHGLLEPTCSMPATRKSVDELNELKNDLEDLKDDARDINRRIEQTERRIKLLESK